MSAHTPPEDFEVPVPEIDREIYAMPMFVTQGDTSGTGRISFSHTGPVEELDDVSAALRGCGGGEATGPRTTPWQAVELEARDRDGHVVVLTAPPEGPPPDGWDDFVRSAIVE